eukprot:COSAG02_NODE_1888_length_10500_cov_3.026536_6_plen_181_part_00
MLYKRVVAADMAAERTSGTAYSPSDGAAMSTPHMRFDKAAMLITRTESARSRVHRLTPAGHRTNTQHLTEISVTHQGEVGEMATQLAQLKQFNADVTNFIEEVQADILQEEQRLTEFLRSQPASPGSPLAGPLLPRERGGSVPSIRPPAASPVSSDHRGSSVDGLRAGVQVAFDGDNKRR